MPEAAEQIFNVQKEMFYKQENAKEMHSASIRRPGRQAEEAHRFDDRSDFGMLTSAENAEWILWWPAECRGPGQSPRSSEVANCG